MRFISAFLLVCRRLFDRVPRDFWFILALLVVNRAILTMIGYAAWRFFGSITTSSLDGIWQFSHDPWWLVHDNPLLSVWGHWDSNWYLKIAHEGYLAADRFGLVFFPLFPLMARALGTAIGGDLFVGGLIINNVALVVTLWYLYKFCRERWDRDVAIRCAKYLIIFPTSFYISGYLSEALFIMISVMTFYYAYKRWWLIAGPLAGLLAISRPVGILIIVPLLLLYLQEHWNTSRMQRVRDLLNLSWIPVAFGAFVLLQWQLTKEWFVLARLEELGWHRHFIDPISAFKLGLVNFTNHFLLAAGLTPYILLVLVRKRIGWPLFTWGIVAMLPALLTGLVGLPRYIISVFPMYIALALLTKHRKVDEVFTTTFALCQGVLMLLWVINAPFLQ